MSTPSPLPTGIRSLRIQNFRAIDELNLQFEDPRGEILRLAVIAGPNGCGKTSVLETCLLATGHGSKMSHELSTDDVRQGVSGMAIEVTVRSKGIVGEKEARIAVGADGTRVDSIGVRNLAYFGARRGPFMVGPVRGVSIASSGPWIPDPLNTRIDRIKQDLVGAMAFAAIATSPEQRANAGAVTRINDAWRELRPNTRESFRVEPIGDHPGLGFDVFLEDPPGKRIELDRLSSGELEVFGYFGWMAASGFSDGIILIDEPELHLDPQWHVVLLRAFMKLLPNVQFIVGTHSPEIYDSAKTYERFFLVPPGDPREKSWSKTGMVAAEPAAE